MSITFQINYRTEFGQALCVIETGVNVMGWTEATPLKLICQGTDFWTGEITSKKSIKEITYKYAIRLEDGRYIYEAGKPRELTLGKGTAIVVRDFWQKEDEDSLFYSTVFSKALFVHKATREDKKEKVGNIYFSLDAAQVKPTQGVGIIGNIPQLGNWDRKDMLRLTSDTFPIWKGAIKVESEQVIEYKYCIYNLESGEVEDIEWGENRQIWGIRQDSVIMQNDRAFRHTYPHFKGAGVAVPVFSLRTNDSMGIGEFLDLKKLADWAAMTGQSMIQTLPINDTTLTHSNLDSYPYNAVSVFALHPIYLHIPAMGKLSAVAKKKYEQSKKTYNGKTFADYQAVYDEKTYFFQLLYKQDWKKLSEQKEYQEFYDKNCHWLKSYAAFLSQRDGQTESYYYYLQYHAHIQLKEAVDYAHSVGVAMKGDIPIGISPVSVDAHESPDLFNLNASAGAPPDDFSITGQNWGFPTYNWDVMRKDGFQWWKARFRKMGDYFDAYRIDHILGFFRIWQMRKEDVWGLCGHFSPALPYSMDDLRYAGIVLDEDRMLKPYIRSNFLNDVFGYDTEEAKEKYLNTNDGYIYWFKDEFNTQRKIQDYFEKHAMTDEKGKNIMNGLLYLHSEVLFVRDQKNPHLYHPRISITRSHSFTELYDDQKHAIENLYNDYFYRRHNRFWYESAMSKLPELIHATGMLCCGEDLGMVPDCVPSVMRELKILSLEIQRMPKNPNLTFAHPADAPYLSVCTTGTHDMNPLRAWWKEDRQVTQRYYNEQMGWYGEAPWEMTGEMVEAVIRQHMYSPAMWVILPLQDWIGMDENVRLENAEAERINVPSNPRHFWNYRMHLTIEELMTKTALNEKIKGMTSIRN